MQIDYSKYDLIKNINLIIEECQLSNIDMAVLLNIPLFKFNYFMNVKKDIPAFAVDNLSNALNVSFEKLCSGDFDMATLKEHLKGDTQHIPARLKENAYSKLRTIQNALEFAEDKFHPSLSAKIKKDLQLPKDISGLLDENISVSAVNQVFKSLKKAGAKRSDFFDIGQQSVSSFMASPFGDMLWEHHGKQRYWEALFESNGGIIELVDRNFEYRIVSLNKQRARIQMSTRGWAKDHFKCNNYGDDAFLQNAAGFASSLCFNYNGNYSAPKTLKCITNSDDFNLIEIPFN